MQESLNIINMDVIIVLSIEWHVTRKHEYK